MGGCVVSVMEARNRGALVPNDYAQKLQAYGPNSIAVPGTETATSSAIYHNPANVDPADFAAKSERLAKGRNLVENFSMICEKKKEEKTIAYRPVLKRVKEMCYGNNMQKMLEVTYLGETEYMALGDLWKTIVNFSRGLGELGIAARSNISIYEETRWEWLATIYGIWLQDMVASTVYANLGEDALAYALCETESKAIVCNAKSVGNLVKSVAAGSFPPCVIIYMDDLPTDSTVVADGAAHGCRMVAWKEVVAMGEAAAETRATRIPPKEDNETICLIMYTSGTTGNPKGVMHTYRSLTSGTRIMEVFMESLLPPPADGRESYCAYLPMAHILEFGVVNVFLGRGAVVGFGSPRTLTDVTARPHGDFQEFKPDCIVAVPRVFDTVRRAVEAKLPPPGSLKREVFDAAYQSKLAALKEGKDTPFYNEKVFKQAREALGGSFRLLLSGGGPISAATQEFVNVVFGSIINGWGLTETVCVGAIQRLGDLESNCSGQVLELEELKLVDTEEYKHTDVPEPRGEICLRGPFLFSGYYKQPQLTKEAIDEDGWFHTGDIGSVTPEGKVRIIGRIKALAKNCLGEYIALETLEAIYGNHPLVLNNNACVLVHPDRNYIAAIAVTDEPRAMKFAKEKNIENAEWPAVLEDPAFLKAAALDMAAMAAKAKRKHFECVRHVRFTTAEWTPDNGFTTAAMKIRRNVIASEFADKIADMFTDE